MMSKLLTLDQVAELMGMSKQSIRRWTKMGFLKGIQFGRFTRYDPGYIEQVMRDGVKVN
jgi:excisionase family DNA binding protein